jgi:hypothetical protein
MPGLMALRRARLDNHMAGARSWQPAHDDPDAVLIETLTEARADVRWVSVQHLLHAGITRRRRSVGRPGDRRQRAESDAARRSSRGKARRSREYWCARTKRSSGPTVVTPR